MTQTQYQIALISAAVLFLAMIFMNVLANALPINGETTGGVSFKYPNLFQPSGFTFSIWGIIYALLFASVIFQLFQWNIPLSEQGSKVILVLFLFALSSVLNIVWLLLWHHHHMLLSTLVIILLLTTLVLASHYAFDMHLLIRVAFSTYAGWMTIASIANITILFVSYGVEPYTEKAVWITVGIMIIGLIIGILYTFIQKDIAFGLVFVWAYLGILLRHIRLEDLPRRFNPMIYTSSMGIILLIVSIIFTLINLKK